MACDCGMEQRAARVMERARIPKRYEHCDFESYVPDLTDGKTWMPQHAQSMKQAKMLTQGFVRDYPGAAEKGLLLMGPSGVGKTHLAVAALKELIRRGHGGFFCDYRELLKEIQASYNPASESTEMRILEPMRNVEILVLDDLGATQAVGLGARHCGHRLECALQRKPHHRDHHQLRGQSGGGGRAFRLPGGRMIPASREDTLEQRIGSRMRSRLYEMCRTVEVNAPDFRRERTQAGRAQS